jgi:multidrug efflux pump subunit AcrB
LKKSLKSIYKSDGQDRLLPRLSLVTFDHYRVAAIIWALLVLFGALSYGVFLKRQGFPSISIPYSIISGAYLVSDPARVDREVAKPISDVIVKDDRVKTVETSARGAFFTVVVQYKEGTDPDVVGKELEQKVKQTANLPQSVQLQIQSPRFGFTARGDDAVISLYRNSSDTTGDLQPMADEADKLVQFVKAKNIDGIKSISTIDPFVDGVNPANGQMVSSQRTFDRYAERVDGTNNYYQSVAVGIMQYEGSDVIKLDEQLRKTVDEYNAQAPNSDYKAVVSASFATDIKHQIGELQKALLEGLVAVLLIGSLVIAVRASLVTVVSMVSVLSITVGVLYIAGYTLNTITLFALILCLGLIVDDTIIMVEALDAQRRRLKSARDIVRTATKKVSRAMVAATLTASLSFAPLLFVGGILGSFIRAIPVTVITSLLVSLTVALVFIPLFARFLLLGKKQLGSDNIHEPAAEIESKIAGFIARPLVWAGHKRKRLVSVGLTAILVSFIFIGASGFLFQKIAFNIFPPSKDTNGLTLTLSFPPGTTISQAQAIVDRADKVVADKLGENFVQASYYAIADDMSAQQRIDILPYEHRDVRSPQLRDELQAAFDTSFSGAKAEVGQLDVGPPASSFTVRVVSENRQQSLKLSNDIKAYLEQVTLTRASGETAKLKDVTASDPTTYSRSGGEVYMSVTAGFNGDDTTTLVTLAQAAVKDKFNETTLRSYGLNKDAVRFDIGQEQENQDSFKSLAIAFPILLVAIFILLALQFRSLLQPLLIFMAIPFSLFGITLGLFVTDNPFSFFAMLGFFALVGLSLKNSILLTDYANQLRRSGSPPVEAAIGALHERFRPLVATSLTAVVSLIPLAIASPFWEGLSVVLIGGLLSSTFLVVTVFPYYYLGAEYLRIKIRRRYALSVIAILAIAAVLLARLA